MRLVRFAGLLRGSQEHSAPFWRLGEGWPCVCKCVRVCTVCACVRFSPRCSSHQQSLLNPAAFSNKDWLPITEAFPPSLSLSLAYSLLLPLFLFFCLSISIIPLLYTLRTFIWQMKRNFLTYNQILKGSNIYLLLIKLDFSERCITELSSSLKTKTRDMVQRHTMVLFIWARYRQG